MQLLGIFFQAFLGQSLLRPVLHLASPFLPRLPVDGSGQFFRGAPISRNVVADQNRGRLGAAFTAHSSYFSRRQCEGPHTSGLWPDRQNRNGCFLLCLRHGDAGCLFGKALAIEGAGCDRADCHYHAIPFAAPVHLSPNCFLGLRPDEMASLHWLAELVGFAVCSFSPVSLGVGIRLSDRIWRRFYRSPLVAVATDHRLLVACPQSK